MTMPAPESHVPLAPHDFQILLSLLDRPMHGYSIIKDVEERTDGELKLGTSTAYAALRRMSADGLLEPAEPPGDESSGGPRRRYWGITTYGRRVAEAEGRRIARLQAILARTSLLDGAR